MMVGWLVTEKLVQTKHGELMEFVTFEDATALYDATLFPATYRRFCHLLIENKAYLLTGLIEEDFGAVAFTVEELRCLTPDDLACFDATTEKAQNESGFCA
jgi:error-prone DNA polymerase